MATDKAARVSGGRNTKDRIYEAAHEEFSSKGLSGARVASIAKRADVNIRMIYYFFESKSKLLDAVLSRIFERRKAKLQERYDSVGELLVSYFDSYSDDPESVRLLQWEALEMGGEGAARLSSLEDRKVAVQRRVEAIKDLQARGAVADDLDPTMIYLMLVAMSIYPMTYPQTVFITSGKNPSDADFKARYRAMLEELGERVFAPRSR